jgi:hypothetical protein
MRFVHFSNCIAIYTDKVTFPQALEQIGEIYFGIQIQRPTSILDMMGSLFGGPSGPAGPQHRQIAADPTSVDLD